MLRGITPAMPHERGGRTSAPGTPAANRTCYRGHLSVGGKGNGWTMRDQYMDRLMRMRQEVTRLSLTRPLPDVTRMAENVSEGIDTLTELAEEVFRGLKTEGRVRKAAQNLRDAWEVFSREADLHI